MKSMQSQLQVKNSPSIYQNSMVTNFQNSSRYGTKDDAFTTLTVNMQLPSMKLKQAAALTMNEYQGVGEQAIREARVELLHDPKFFEALKMEIKNQIKDEIKFAIKRQIELAMNERFNQFMNKSKNLDKFNFDFKSIVNEYLDEDKEENI